MKLEDILHALNPDAVLKRSEFGQLPLDEILNSHLFNFDRASASAGTSPPLSPFPTPPAVPSISHSSSIYLQQRLAEGSQWELCHQGEADRDIQLRLQSETSFPSKETLGSGGR